MKVKVLHITKMKGVSGSENHLLTLLSHIDKHRFDIHYCILSEARHVSLLSEYKKTLEKAGVTVQIVVMHKYLDVSLLLKLRKYILLEKFDIVHTHLIHADLYGTLAAKLAGDSIIISSRHNDDKFRHNILLIWLNRLLARWQTTLIVISDWIGQFLQEAEGILPEKIVRIHYGLEPENITIHADKNYVRQQFQIPDTAPVIGTIGRLTEQKGHVYLFQAIKQVIPSFPELRVIMIGDGELRTISEQQVQKLDIEKNVIFTGFKHRDEAIKLLSGFDFFVFPSLWEGFGLVLLEAMALQKAVVASNASAIPESVFDRETGILVPPKDSVQLAKALLTLLHDRDLNLSMGRASYERLQENFSVSKMVKATEELYMRLVRNRG